MRRTDMVKTALVGMVICNAILSALVMLSYSYDSLSKFKEDSEEDNYNSKTTNIVSSVDKANEFDSFVENVDPSLHDYQIIPGCNEPEGNNPKRTDEVSTFEEREIYDFVVFSVQGDRFEDEFIGRYNNANRAEKIMMMQSLSKAINSGEIEPAAVFDFL